jgi:ubiquinone biosynthesis monooxygenase Coq7
MHSEDSSRLIQRPLEFHLTSDSAPPWAEFKTPGEQLPAHVLSDLRTDHAGEVGAVWIYKAILMVSRDAKLRVFAEHHLATEQSHLEKIKAWLPPQHFSKLIALWKVAGFMTGALPALFGPRTVYATIQSVETFVDQHYEEQLQAFKLEPQLSKLCETLEECQADEVKHRDEASLALGEFRMGFFLRCWCAIVSWGSKNAVTVCRYI